MSGAGTYRLTKGGHSRRESAGFCRYARGEQIVLTDAESTQLKGRVELVSLTAPISESAVSTTTASAESPDKITPPVKPRTRRARRS